MVSDADLLNLLDRAASLTAPERAALLAHASGDVSDADRLPSGTRRPPHPPAARSAFRRPHGGDRCLPALPGAGQLRAGRLGAGRLAGRRCGGARRRSRGLGGQACRPATTADLLLALRSATPAEARERLVGAVVIAARRGSAALDASALPAGVVDEIGRRLAEADASLTSRCRSGATSAAGVAAITRRGRVRLAELRDWERRLQWEIHVLARAYGWRERDRLLSVPARRRRVYLGLVANG